MFKPWFGNGLFDGLYVGMLQKFRAWPVNIIFATRYLQSGGRARKNISLSALSSPASTRVCNFCLFLDLFQRMLR